VIGAEPRRFDAADVLELEQAAAEGVRVLGEYANRP
jgi:hypothetical protein